MSVNFPTPGSLITKVDCGMCTSRDGMLVIGYNSEEGSSTPYTAVTLQCVQCKSSRKYPLRELSVMLGGHKDDSEKPKIHLIPADVMIEQAKLWTLGANKYRADNWKEGMDFSRCYNALMRHLYAWWLGEERDPDNGQHHLDSVIWCAIVLRYYCLHDPLYRKFDDRPILFEITSTTRKPDLIHIPFDGPGIQPADYNIGELNETDTSNKTD